jgi:hypothetical protein
VAAASYAGFVGAAWLRYGHAAAPAADEVDPLLDLFMPAYDVAERHHIDVAAPAALTFGALMDMDLEQSLLVRAIFKGRQLLLGADPDTKTAGRSLVEVTKALGWVVLADMPGHEIVMGAVTRPWEPNVIFRGIPPEEFAAFNEPEYVKIVWTLRADALSPYSSIARSETRAVATDEAARRKFRWYWGYRADSRTLDAPGQQRGGEARHGATPRAEARQRVSSVRQWQLDRNRRAP